MAHLPQRGPIDEPNNHMTPAQANKLLADSKPFTRDYHVNELAAKKALDQARDLQANLVTAPAAKRTPAAAKDAKSKIAAFANQALKYGHACENDRASALRIFQQLELNGFGNLCSQDKQAMDHPGAIEYIDQQIMEPAQNLLDFASH